MFARINLADIFSSLLKLLAKKIALSEKSTPVTLAPYLAQDSVSIPK